MTSTKQIPISHGCTANKIKSEDLLVEKNLSQVCYMGKYGSKSIITDETSTDKSESEYVHKNV